MHLSQALPQCLTLSSFLKNIHSSDKHKIIIDNMEMIQYARDMILHATQVSFQKFALAVMMAILETSFKSWVSHFPQKNRHL